MKFSYRLFKHDREVVLAIADFSILGKSFEEKGVRMSVTDFYKGETCNEKRATELIRGATIVNAVGRDIISLMLAEKLISSTMVLSVAGVPHAQIVSL